MRTILVWTGLVLGTPVLAFGLLLGAMWASPDIRYRAAYLLVENFDLNGDVTTAELRAQSAALHRAVLVGQDGHRFAWRAGSGEIVWINLWANWCVPCRMEFPAMQALRARVGKAHLRIVLLSPPKYFEADKKLARAMGLDFELVSPRDPRVADLAAMQLGHVRKGRAVGEIMPSNSFFRGDGTPLAGFRAPRPWDSLKWEGIVRGWLADGKKPAR